MKRFSLTVAVLVAALPVYAAESAEVAELRAQLALQQAQIAAQQQQLDALAGAVERQPATGMTSTSQTTLGFYGEVHYNGLREPDAATGKNNIHAHRAVLLLSHAFNDNLHFYSEFEFEGAPDSTEVETELEQAFIDWRLSSQLSLNVGQFLVPVGLLNESHEPNVFYGVERNPVEEKVIPATWWEKGVMLRSLPLPGVAVDVAVHNGLRGDIATLGGADGLREFRQEFGGARAEDLAQTLRVRYSGIPGLSLGLTVQHQDNITQSHDLLVGGKSPALLRELHADWQWHTLRLRALATDWRINNSMAKTLGTDRLEGFYVEPSWRPQEAWGFFARYNRWNTAANQAGVADQRQLNVGVNYWLTPQVVFKADVQDTDQSSHRGDGFNLGLGLSF